MSSLIGDVFNLLILQQDWFIFGEKRFHSVFLIQNKNIIFLRFHGNMVYLRGAYRAEGVQPSQQDTKIPAPYPHVWAKLERSDLSGNVNGQRSLKQELKQETISH